MAKADRKKRNAYYQDDKGAFVERTQQTQEALNDPNTIRFKTGPSGDVAQVKQGENVYSPEQWEIMQEHKKSAARGISDIGEVKDKEDLAKTGQKRMEFTPSEEAGMTAANITGAINVGDFERARALIDTMANEQAGESKKVDILDRVGEIGLANTEEAITERAREISNRDDLSDYQAKRIANNMKVLGNIMNIPSAIFNKLTGSDVKTMNKVVSESGRAYKEFYQLNEAMTGMVEQATSVEELNNIELELGRLQTNANIMFEHSKGRSIWDLNYWKDFGYTQEMVYMDMQKAINAYIDAIQIKKDTIIMGGV